MKKYTESSKTPRRKPNPGGRGQAGEGWNKAHRHARHRPTAGTPGEGGKKDEKTRAYVQERNSGQFKAMEAKQHAQEKNQPAGHLFAERNGHFLPCFVS
ncbi:MAG: hypothetical protein H5U01_01205 [Clostridia bacterium]|nr:hypothetical protein [Clostridia bacterium]